MNLRLLVVPLLLQLIHLTLFVVQGLSSRHQLRNNNRQTTRSVGIQRVNHHQQFYSKNASSLLGSRLRKEVKVFPNFHLSSLDSLISRDKTNNDSRVNFPLRAVNEDIDDTVAASASGESKSSKVTLITAFATALTSVIILAKLNLIGPYTNALIIQDTGLTVLATVLALLFVKSITTLAVKNILEPRDSRKIIHTLSAPLFIVLWPFFTDLWGAKLFALTVPFLQAIRLWLAATNKGGSDGDELAGAISRTGKASHISSSDAEVDLRLLLS